MSPEAEAIWAGLEFRAPAMFRLIEPLSADQLVWPPQHGANPIAWQLWHIAEVEDNWVLELLEGQARRFPFGRSVREAHQKPYPPKSALLDYFREVRELSRQRLAATSPTDFGRVVMDPHFGALSVRALWAGVVTSFAWHAGQIALTVRLLHGGAPMPGAA